MSGMTRCALTPDHCQGPELLCRLGQGGERGTKPGQQQQPGASSAGGISGTHPARRRFYAGIWYELTPVLVADRGGIAVVAIAGRVRLRGPPPRVSDRAAWCPV